MSDERTRHRDVPVQEKQEISNPDFFIKEDEDDVLQGTVSVPDSASRREYFNVTVTVEMLYGFGDQNAEMTDGLATCQDTRADGYFPQPGIKYDLTVTPPGGDPKKDEKQCMIQLSSAGENQTRRHEFTFKAPDEMGQQSVDVSVDLYKWKRVGKQHVAQTEGFSTSITVEEFDLKGERSLRRLTDADEISVRDLANQMEIGTDPISVRELFGAIIQAAQGEPPDFVDSTWSNWVGERDRPDVLSQSDKRKLFKPEDRFELLSGMKYLVEVEDKHIRAVGSGHSHSNAPAPREHYVDITDLKATSPDELLDQPWLKSSGDLDVDKGHLVRVPAGTVLKQLNRDVLAPAGLALENMGSFDGQTLAGAINTATHGTGIELETLADMVKSVEMVTVEENQEGDPEVKMVRVEPENGITESGANTGRMELIQDDDTFYSVVAGFGCMGIAVAYTMRVRDSFWLKETTVLMKWNEVKPKLETDEVEDISDVPKFIKENRHVQLLVNLPDVHNSDDPNPLCMVRTHEVVDPEDRPDDWAAADDRWPPERRKTPFRDFANVVGNSFHPLKDVTAWDAVGLGPDGWAGTLENNFFSPEATKNNKPFINDRTKTASYIALKRIRDRGNFPPKPPQRAISTDIAVPLSDLVDAVEDTFDVADDIKQTHEVDPIWRKFARGVAGLFGGSGPEPRDVEFDIHFGSPMGIRFTAPSDHDMSSAYDQWSAMFEVPFPVAAANAKLLPEVPDLSGYEMREKVAKPALEEIETHAIQNYDGRPHMGKTNTLDKGTLSDLYGTVFDGDGGWMETYERFNAFGTFDNAFTDQLGISNR